MKEKHTCGRRQLKTLLLEVTVAVAVVVVVVEVELEVVLVSWDSCSSIGG